MRCLLHTVLPLSVLGWASVATAGTHALVPAGGGLAALDVKVDLTTGVVRSGATPIPIGLEAGALPDEADVVVESVAVGGGRSVAHVRVPTRGSGASGVAWEALLTAARPEPIFAGTTGLSKGDPGERTGLAIRVVVAGSASRVLVGDIREDLRICGQTETLLEPRALDAASFELKPVEVQRLSATEQSAATQLLATDKGAAFDAPLGKLLVAHGSSDPDSWGIELTDGDVHTVWREKRPGTGIGEFVVMASPEGVPITRIQFAVSSPGRVGPGAIPKTFYVVTNAHSYRVALPEAAARKPGEVFEVAFPEPVETSCLALVLDQATPGWLAHPEVGVAELVAFSDFDVAGATLDSIAEKLSGSQGLAAAQLLERSGAGGLAAVTKAYTALDSRGRALAVDVAAASERCEDAGPILARALCEKEGEAPRKALEKLERCPAAAAALAQLLRTDASSRACIAPTLSTLSPVEALEPIGAALGDTPESDPSTRSILRAAFGRALQRAGGGRLATLLAAANGGPAARLEMLRGAEEQIDEAPAAADAAIAELLRADGSTRVRYLVLGPLATLARAGDSVAKSRLLDALERDPEWPVRARAAELSTGLPEANGPLALAARDPEPRVRAAALVSLATSPGPDAVHAAIGVMAADDWSFVKMSAANLLAHAPASREVDDRLGLSLGDPLVSVRGAALVALARRRAVMWNHAIRDRLDDENEDIHLRAAAASALGAVCDVSATDRLTDLARQLVAGGEGDEVRLGLAAIVGLAALHPPDLQKRLGPLLSPSANPAVRAAAERALAVHGACP
jgi:HEAT repeat protein